MKRFSFAKHFEITKSRVSRWYFCQYTECFVTYVPHKCVRILKNAHGGYFRIVCYKIIELFSKCLSNKRMYCFHLIL